MRLSRKGLALSFFALMLSILAGSLAWACTGQAQIQMIPTTVPARSQVSATEILAHPGPVLLHWNSKNGPVLASINVPEGMPKATFSVTIPDVAPGVYYLVMETGQDVARTSIEVTDSAAPAKTAVSSDLWRGLSHSSGLQPAAEVSGASSPSSLPFTAGVALLAFSVTALAGAAVVVGPSRRRSAAKRASS